MKTVSASLKELVVLLKEESSSSDFALGYLESLTNSIIQELPKARQKRIQRDLEVLISFRKGE